jgi:tetratricopeptide (TPR) repeat protein
MTNDTVWNIWQDGIQVSLISFFTNYPDELKVRQPATVSVLIQGSGLKNYPLFTQSDTRNISRRLDTELILTGSLLKSGDEIRINVQLFDTQKGESVKSFEIQGPAKESIVVPLVDSLKLKIRNYLLISRIKKHEPYTQYFHLAPNVSPEAYRYFVLGNMALKKTDWVTAIDLFTKALESDSTIGIQGVYSSLTSANLNLEKFKDAKAWCLKGYGKSEKMDLWVKLTTEYQYSNLFETPADAVKYAEQMISIDDKLPSGHWKLGDLYFNSQQWGKAIPEFEKVLELYESWKLKPFFIPNYSELGYAYHKNGNRRKIFRMIPKLWINMQFLLSLLETLLRRIVGSGNMFQKEKNNYGPGRG